MNCENSAAASSSSVKGKQTSSSNVRVKKSEGGDCPHCHKFFHKLKQHVNQVHGTERNYSCLYCPFRFKRDEHLRNHLRRIHKITA